MARVSPATTEALNAMKVALSRIAAGDDAGEDYAAASDRALASAVHSATQSRSRPDPLLGYTPTLNEVVGENINRLRKESGWSQERLADAMSARGFRWHQRTVAEAESGSRRFTLEEACVLSALFAEPVVALLIPNGPDIDVSALIELSPEVTAPASVLYELVVGCEGRAGHGGLTWLAAAQVAGIGTDEDTPRPAVGLWTQRRETERRASTTKGEQA